MTGTPGTTGRPVVVSMGSNLGDRLDTLDGALAAWRETPGVMVVAVSPVYETAPVDAPDGSGDFLNVVVLLHTDLPAALLLERAQAIESAFDRRRSGTPNEPRTLDVDLVAVGEEASDDPVLTLPHPRAHLRAFVLVPWHAVDPDAVLPGRGRVDALLDALDPSELADVVRRDDLELGSDPW